MKKSILFFYLILTISPVLPQDIRALKSNIDLILSERFFDTTQIGIDVYDLTANERLYSKNERLLFRPASNLKILTTAAALIFLGPDYNFNTSIAYTGKIEKGTLQGDLYIIGGCDPEFNMIDLDSLVSIVSASGIKNIQGNLIGDISMSDSLVWGQGWMWDDDCPFLTSLDINANSIGVYVKPLVPGTKPDIILIPNTDYVQVDNEAVTVPADSPGTLTVDKDWLHQKNIIIIKGNVPEKLNSDSLQDILYTHVYEPELYFLTLLGESLAGSGITVSGKKYFSKAPLYSKELYEYHRQFGSIINHLNKESYNLGAEMTLRALSAKYFGTPACAGNGIKMIDSLIILCGMNPGDYRIVDGSGISHYNLISASLLLSVIKYIYFQKPELYKIFYSSLPVAGVDGTLRNRMTRSAAFDNVHAKTGTLSGVSCLSGYVNASNSHLLAFSMLLQNFTGSSKSCRDYEDKICNILAEFK
jgi:D-alanyl-D-alanine carboxypeptidase/D-alanyl-D-alanine-endopeptidase (penicillin-binding protein 4)